MLSHADNPRSLEETLAPADLAVARLYRVLLRLADTVARGEEPSCRQVDPMTVAGLHGLIEDGESWRDLVPGHARRQPWEARVPA